jgi:DNA polymerase III sliding clamp (beta) subunit (PCNA family)
VISFNPGYLLDGLAAAAICGAARAGETGGEPAPGRIRLEFTSAAKPALITWADYPGFDEESDAEPAEEGTPAFRYLVVPLRVAVTPGPAGG